MEMKFRALLSLAVVLLVASLMGCGGHYKCGTTFGNATCNGSGSGIGGERERARTIAAGNAAVLTYFLSGNTLDAAGFGGSTFAGLSGYTAPTLPSGFADLMTIVNKQFVYVPMGDTHRPGFQHQPLDRRSERRFRAALSRPTAAGRQMAHGAILKGDSYL